MPTTTDPPFYDLVVIGSSAGGIEALARLVSTLPASFPAPIVLAQHLDPSRPSKLTEILARRTTLTVRQLEDGAPVPLQPRTVYVVPAAHDVEITDDSVQVHAELGMHGKPSIDLLLTSAARAHAERTIAVILTGTGSDGADGARMVKNAGGMVIIENPQTASYPMLPASLAPSTVDIAADLDHIGPLLYDLLSGAYVVPSPAAEPDDTLQMLLAAVQAHTGIDFTHYKPPTISRRLQWRMAATGTLSLDEYTKLVDRDPDEYARLAASFLINVTEFFRDPTLYAYLREQVIPDLIAYGRAHGNRLRIWSSGCATGEEAYSIAILIAEALGPKLPDFTVHIFATDADAEAIAFARRGIYAPAALASVPEPYKTRYFTQIEGGYAVDKKIRGLVVFGEHDLGKRAPFPDMDMVLCRNVFIYFTPELQRRALQLFAFSLRQGGYLVLGTAESPTAMTEYFAPVETRLRVYRRQGGRVLIEMLPISASSVSPLIRYPPAPTPALVQALPPHSNTARQTHVSQDADKDEQPARIRFRSSLDRLGDQMLSLSAGVVVVDKHYDVQTINGAAYEMLDILHAARGKDLLHLAERVPTKPLRAAIDAAFHAAPLDDRQVRIAFDPGNGALRHLQITCYPHYAGPTSQTGAEAGNADAMDVVVLLITETTGEQAQEVEGQQAAMAGPETSANGRRRRGRLSPVAQSAAEVERLAQALDQAQGTIRELRMANQDLRDANQELIRDNDELVVNQEEAQAATEQAKTLNEELQATNEELETLNEEMEATLEQLHTTNDDLQERAFELENLAAEREEQRRESDQERQRLSAILASMSDALLVVDTSGEPILTNTAYDQLFGTLPNTPRLEDADGRPLPLEATPQRRVLDGESFTMEFGLLNKDGTRHWLEARGVPIRGEGSDLGGVVAVRDITERTALTLQEQFLALVSHELRGPLASLTLALQLLSRAMDAHALTGTILEFRDIGLRQAGLLSGVIDDLSDLARARHGKLVLHPRPTDLAALTQQIVADLNVLHARSGDAHRVLVHMLPTAASADPASPTSPLWIRGDPLRLRQIVSNLLTNALTHAPSAERIDVTLEQKDGWVELRVQDYGPGIAPADLPRLFKPYFQAEGAAPEAEPQHGLGLGLFIVAELVKAHGGTIAVQSERNVGTRFVLRFPLTTQQPEGVGQTEQVTEDAIMDASTHASADDHGES